MSEIPQYTPLTPEQVAEAENRDGFTHPFFTTLTINRQSILEHHNNIAGMSVQEQQYYIRDNYGFLADEFVRTAAEYRDANEELVTLTPTDLISLWSYVYPYDNQSLGLSQHERYAIASIITATYSIQGTQHEAWSLFPRYLIERKGLPEEITNATGIEEDARRIVANLDAIKKSYNIVDEAADDDIETDENEKYFLKEIRENFGPGFGSVDLLAGMLIGD